jgi:uncharacterized membrane protein (UPF0127 family)
VRASLTILLIALGSLIMACADDDDVQSRASSTPTPVASEGFLTVLFEGASGQKGLIVELADSPEERRTGLRNRQSMDVNRGMLFAWPKDSTSAFGMPETYIPLTIAFIQEDGTIVHLEDMEPLTTNPHRSPEPYRYAVEANQGWFATNGIGVGDIAAVPKDAAAEAR